MQRRTFLLISAATLSAVIAGSALAQATFTAWGHEFTVSTFAPQEMMVAVATDRKSGRKFNVIKLRDGKMMAILPINRMKSVPRLSKADMIR